jgi:lipid-binding SYLF domain-containing protein
MSFIRTAALLLVAVVGCASSPKTVAETRSLEQRADATLNEMVARDPGLRDLIASSAGYAVFPDIAKGGAIVGGAYGEGVLYEHGKPTGIVSLKQASIGAQLGGQTFAELLVLRDPLDVQRLKQGKYDVGANASAVALKAGAAAQATSKEGAVVFLMPRGGLMVDLSVSGQKIDYEPLRA